MRRDRSRAGIRKKGGARGRKARRGAASPRSAADGTENRWVAKARERAEAFLARFERETGRKLDFALDRVQALDRYLEKHFESEPPLPDDAIEAAGFYFSEIWREAFGGEYVWDEEKGALAIRKGSISVFPVEKVARVLREKTAGALETYAFLYAKRTSAE